MEHTDDPSLVLAKNQEVFAALYTERAANLAPIVERVRRAPETVREAIRQSHGARCTWGGELLDRLVGAQVLEVGGGSGETACMMLALGAERVVTTEITDEAGEMMRALGDELGYGDRLEVLIGDFRTLPLGEPHSYDVVMAKEVLHHIPMEEEDEFIARMALMLAPTGMARLKDPAVNSRLLDELRWAVPVPDRPSKLLKPAEFAAWQADDVHPVRDNSTRHVAELLHRHFRRVDIEVVGTVARFHRLVDSDKWHDVALERLNRLDQKVPTRVQMLLGDNHGLSAYDPI